MEEFAEDEAIIAAGPSPQNSSDDSDESDDGRSDLSMSHYDSHMMRHIERLVEELETGDACVKEEAAIGLYRLTTPHNDANLAAIATAGAIPPLLALVRSAGEGHGISRPRRDRVGGVAGRNPPSRERVAQAPARSEVRRVLRARAGCRLHAVLSRRVVPDCGLHEDVSKCPICRVPIEQKRRVYVS